MVVAGAGIAGISAAYHLVKRGVGKVVLADSLPPLSVTSDKSTEGYRNLFSDARMVSFMNRSIDLLDKINDESDNQIQMNRNGYLFVATSENSLNTLVSTVKTGCDAGAGMLRKTNYRTDVDMGADVLNSNIREVFPCLADSVVGGTHIRRAGWMSAQQLGMFMLDYLNSAGSHRFELVKSNVVSRSSSETQLCTVTLEDNNIIHTSRLVVSTGPMLRQSIKSLTGLDFPVYCELHLKASFHDYLNAVPRDLPFLIYSSPTQMYMTESEKSILQAEANAGDAASQNMLDIFPGGVHVRPDGNGNSCLLLWTYRTEVYETPIFPIPTEDHGVCGELCLRGMAQVIPALRQYIDEGNIPKMFVDGGYYCKTADNRPLVGPVGVPGVYLCGAMSGYGIMSSQAAGETVAMHVMGESLPNYASAVLPERVFKPDYMGTPEDMLLSGKTDQL